MEEPNLERRLAAVLAADVVGYSRLMEVDEAGTLARLKTVRLELIDPAIARCKGRIIKTTGDGMLVEFQSVTEALRCAVDFQERMARRNRDMPASRKLLYRIGINLGDVIVEEGDIFGDGVNVAARLEAMAEPGGICISAAVRDQVGDRLDVGYEDLGDRHVKKTGRFTSLRFSLMLKRRPLPVLGPRGSRRLRKTRANRRSRSFRSST
jgi:adenylate cyclase